MHLTPVPLLRYTSPPAPSPEGEGVLTSKFFVMYLHCGSYKENKGAQKESLGNSTSPSPSGEGAGG